MKELSIEEKAKAYDKAIETFDVILNLNNVKEKGTIFVDDIRKIFPELKESEDERIRKELLQIAKESEDSFYMVMTPNKREKLIAWLEKQAEQKPVDKVEPKFKVGDLAQTKQEWSEEDDKILTSIWRSTDLEYLETQGISKENAYKWIFSIKDRVQPQSQWKPSDEHMIELRQVISGHSYNIERLIELEEQLKKLREE